MEDMLNELRGDTILDLADSDTDNDRNDVESNVEIIISELSDTDPTSENSDKEPDEGNPDWTEVTGDGRNVDVDVFREFSDPVHDLLDDAHPIDYFKLFITDSFITHITEQTNLYAEQCQADRGIDKYWKPVCETDIWKFLYI